MDKAPHLANPKFAAMTDDEVARATWVAKAKREAARPNGDAIRRIVIEELTPLEMELVARGIPAYNIPWPTEAEIAAAALGFLK